MRAQPTADNDMALSVSMTRGARALPGHSPIVHICVRRGQRPWFGDRAAPLAPALPVHTLIGACGYVGCPGAALVVRSFLVGDQTEPPADKPKTDYEKRM